MGSALSDIADGPISSAESTGGCQHEITRTTRTHLLCLSRSHNKFAIQLYQEFAKDGKRPGNFVICPISVSLGLGMLHLGSRGASSEELHKVLYLQEVTVNFIKTITLLSLYIYSRHKVYNPQRHSLWECVPPPKNVKKN